MEREKLTAKGAKDAKEERKGQKARESEIQVQEKINRKDAENAKFRAVWTRSSKEFVPSLPANLLSSDLLFL
jgi:hypothetical protein